MTLLDIKNGLYNSISEIRRVLMLVGLIADPEVAQQYKECKAIIESNDLSESDKLSFILRETGLPEFQIDDFTSDLFYRNFTSLSEFFEIRGANRHPFHIVDPSPWPFLLSIAALATVVGAASYFHSVISGGRILVFGLLFLVSIMAAWWRDVVREATYQGLHTEKVAAGIRLGVALFIISEIMFFFSFFWAYLHSSLAPSIEIGGVWPPIGFKTLNPYSVPLLNTLILLTSGATVTYVHTRILLVDISGAVNWLITTILLAVLFTYFQFNEYVSAPFDISDGIYASVFYLATGFHGLHVIIGTLFLVVALYRTWDAHFSRRHHVGFEAAAWYWHFVDVVWLFLFLLVYVWGSA